MASGSDFRKEDTIFSNKWVILSMCAFLRMAHHVVVQRLVDSSSHGPSSMAVRVLAK